MFSPKSFRKLSLLLSEIFKSVVTPVVYICPNFRLMKPLGILHVGVLSLLLVVFIQGLLASHSQALSLTIPLIYQSSDAFHMFDVTVLSKTAFY